MVMWTDSVTLGDVLEYLKYPNTIELNAQLGSFETVNDFLKENEDVELDYIHLGEDDNLCVFYFRDVFGVAFSISFSSYDKELQDFISKLTATCYGKVSSNSSDAQIDILSTQTPKSYNDYVTMRNKDGSQHTILLTPYNDSDGNTKAKGK